ncbi:MAG: alpha/beta hydrolase [Burkholderiales bacterium]|nr:alpha/beta hydrolase [Burkholderiales bacterium]
MALPPIQAVQTRGGRLAFVASGEGDARIVLVNGAGVSLDGWRALYPAIEKLGRTLAWDRFGVKGSDPPRSPQTGLAIIAALRELLAYAGFEPPYVLVGHSVGALYADLFARLHPAETRAVLFLEAAHVADPQELRSHEGGFARAISNRLEVPPGLLRGGLHGELACLETTCRQLAAAGPFPDVPVGALAGGGHFPQLAQPQRVLREIAGLLARS